LAAVRFGGLVRVSARRDNRLGSRAGDRA
jgi:hypothetical protein